MTMQTDLHIYSRSIDPQKRTSLTALSSLIKPSTKVLDLGCGPGVLASYLKQQYQCIIDGVTLNEEEARQARQHCRQVIVADLDHLDIQQAFRGESYDYIICADVLEHLKKPERILRECRSLLSNTGELLISVPNIAYCGFFLELMQGELLYRPEGILDNTHLKFFTRKSLIRFLQDNHWSVKFLDTIDVPYHESEFKIHHPESYPPAVLNYLLQLPDAFTYQFICSVLPVGNTNADQNQALLNQKINQKSLDFSSLLYWGNNSEYSEKKYLVRAGIIGQSHQCIIFSIPTDFLEYPTLRWDPADRPGFMQLHDVLIKDSSGNLLWRWENPRNFAAIRSNGIMTQPAISSAPGSNILLLSGDDPWLEIPVPPEDLRNFLKKSRCTVEFHISWPMSADYLHLSSEIDKLKARNHFVDTEVLHWRKEAIERMHALEDYQKQQTEFYALIAQLQQKIEEKSQRISQLQNNIEIILGSGSYQLSQKISKLKNKLTLMPKPVHEAQSIASSESTAANTTIESIEVHDHQDFSLSTENAEPKLNLRAQTIAATAALPRPVDIIIPIYKGLEETRTCVESVLATIEENNLGQIILINDQSPQPELTEWLRTITHTQPRIKLIENQVNLGFVNSVNLGMQQNLEHDVLLLNSDTEVANDWLSKIQRAAYSHPYIGTVTPFSNNATICSYPVFCADNPLPKGWDTKQLDHLCMQANAGQTVEIPTAVGFCMFIRRACLQDVGLFDTEHFGKGYGEENDFCMRAKQASWKHMLALDTFVKHSGGISFGASKSSREQTAYNVLTQLHPQYEALIQQHIRHNPAQAARNRIDRLRLQASRLPCVLIVSHSIGGGTQRHIQELVAHFEGQAEFLQLQPLPNNFLRLHWLNVGEAWSEDFYWPSESQRIIELLRQLKISQIHFHHLLGLHPQIMELPAQLGVPYDFTGHDYYACCPQIFLTTAESTYCGEKGHEQCTHCLQERPSPTNESIEAWRLRHRLFLNQARNVLTPSTDAALRLKQYFPDAPVRPIYHLDISHPSKLPVPVAQRIPSHANLRVFILGGVNPAKGANIMEATALLAANLNAPLEFHLLGYPHRPMECQPKASLTIHGAYAENELERLLARFKPDIVWFPALWPETYSYTLSACLEMGLPIVAPDIGAFSERLQGRAWTWLRQLPNTANDWVQFFIQTRQRYFVDHETPIAAMSLHTPSSKSLFPTWCYDKDYLLK